MKKRGTFLDPTLLLSVKNGMKHNIEYIKDVLRYATVNGAKVLGKEVRLGVIRAGAKADLLILDKNPYNGLETLRNSSIFKIAF